MIRDTKSRYYDDPKSSDFPAQFIVFRLIFLHLIRIALVYTSPVAFVYFLRFFFRDFLSKCRQGFSWNYHNFPPPLNKKKKATGNRFVLLRQVYTIFHIENRKTELGKRRQVRDHSWKYQLSSLGMECHESWYFVMLKCRESWRFFSSLGTALRAIIIEELFSLFVIFFSK